MQLKRKSVSAKFFPMLVKTPYFGGVINPKTYVNYELGSKFFFLSDLTYKLVNLLVFEKCSCKISKNWTFQKFIGLGLNFTYEFKVFFTQVNLLVFKRLSWKISSTWSFQRNGGFRSQKGSNIWTLLYGFVELWFCQFVSSTFKTVKLRK